MTKAFCQLILHASTVSLIWRSIKALQNQSRAEVIAADKQQQQQQQQHAANDEDARDNDNDVSSDPTSRSTATPSVTAGVAEMDMEILQLWALYAVHKIYISLGIEWFASFLPLYYYLKMLLLLVTVIPNTRFPNFWFETLLVPFMVQCHNCMDVDWVEGVEVCWREAVLVPWRILDLTFWPGILCPDDELRDVKSRRRDALNREAKQYIAIANANNPQGLAHDTHADDHHHHNADKEEDENADLTRLSRFGRYIARTLSTDSTPSTTVTNNNTNNDDANDIDADAAVTSPVARSRVAASSLHIRKFFREQVHTSFGSDATDKATNTNTTTATITRTRTRPRTTSTAANRYTTALRSAASKNKPSTTTSTSTTRSTTPRSQSAIRSNTRRRMDKLPLVNSTSSPRSGTSTTNRAYSNSKRQTDTVRSRSGLSDNLNQSKSKSRMTPPRYTNTTSSSGGRGTSRYGRNSSPITSKQRRATTTTTTPTRKSSSPRKLKRRPTSATKKDKDIQSFINRTDNHNDDDNHNNDDDYENKTTGTPLSQKVRKFIIGDGNIRLRDYLFDLSLPSVPTPAKEVYNDNGDDDDDKVEDHDDNDDNDNNSMQDQSLSPKRKTGADFDFLRRARGLRSSNSNTRGSDSVTDTPTSRRKSGDRQDVLHQRRERNTVAKRTAKDTTTTSTSTTRRATNNNRSDSASSTKTKPSRRKGSPSSRATNRSSSSSKGSPSKAASDSTRSRTGAKTETETETTKKVVPEKVNVTLRRSRRIAATPST